MAWIIKLNTHLFAFLHFLYHRATYDARMHPNKIESMVKFSDTMFAGGMETLGTKASAGIPLSKVSG